MDWRLEFRWLKETQKEELRSLNPTRRVADGIGERKAWVRQRSRQGENALVRKRRAVVASSGRISCCCLNCAIFSGLHEPPYTEPYVRWCGRTAAVTPPPTRFQPINARPNSATLLYSHPAKNALINQSGSPDLEE